MTTVWTRQPTPTRPFPALFRPLFTAIAYPSGWLFRIRTIAHRLVQKKAMAAAKNDDPFLQSTAQGDLPTVQQMTSAGNVVSRADIRKAFQLACIVGQVQTAKYLHNHGQIDAETYQTSFRHACGNGHWPVAQWLWGPCRVQDMHAMVSAFTKSTLCGYVRVAEWLMTLGAADRYDMKQWAFSRVTYGSLVAAQWLHGLGDIDIHSDEDLAFTNACVGGFVPQYLGGRHVHVAKWLYSLGGVDVEPALRALSCVHDPAPKHMMLPIMRWLSTVHPFWTWSKHHAEKLQYWSPFRGAWIEAVVRVGITR